MTHDLASEAHGSLGVVEHTKHNIIKGRGQSSMRHIEAICKFCSSIFSDHGDG